MTAERKAYEIDAAAPLIRLRDAVVRRSGRVIFSVDDLSINHGESIALLGPNGAGKTTFLKLITREIHPLHREVPPVEFCGAARPLLSEVRSRLGIVSGSMQDEISVHLPALEIVVGGLFGTLGLPKHMNLQVSDEAWEAGRQAMALLGIADLADRDVLTLSSGQARRVLIARAIVHDPETLVFDEPCTGLDPQGMYYVRHSLRELVRSGKSLLLVTHYPEDVIPEVSRLVMIKDGVVFADGPKEELMTSAQMSALFDVPMEVRQEHGYYQLVSEY
ncbi:MAG: ATP-binding cassette domain-containing protein [Coriobacteriaceae bacterium]|nr:ATP-binding cassette domain-containing protein [Coriobacteriaceae bacterium]